MEEENWKRKLEQITRKNKAKERQAYHKAEKIRKDVEQYWNKKNEIFQVRQQSLNTDKRNKTAKPYSLSKPYNKQIKL